MSNQSKPSTAVIVPTKILGTRPKSAFVPAKNLNTLSPAKNLVQSDKGRPRAGAPMRRENTPQARNEANLQSVSELAYVKAQVSKLKTDLEIERLRVVACGVGAQCNTPETIAKQRIASDNPYYCAAVGDVYDAVDREVALRNRVAELEAQVQALKNQ